ncbi:MAG: hypothetical protein GX660_27310 [Clostridiaceae bacterium]|nr:hypothetical protein [Clostridiaceae bacterium]
MEQPYIYIIIVLIICAVYFVLRGKQNVDAKAFLINIKEQTENEFKCPTCNSTQLVSSTRGWHWKTGLRGSDQIIITCLHCGDKWEPVFKSQNKD